MKILAWFWPFILCFSRFRLPIFRDFGVYQGTPVDRYYIKHFLDSNEGRLSGICIEVGDDHFSRYFRRKFDRVFILDPSEVDGDDFLCVDLETGYGVKDETTDVLICLQTLHVIFDLQTAFKNSLRMLRPGGSAFFSFPMISQLSIHDYTRWGDYWRLTPAAIRKLLDGLGDEFEFDLQEYGNFLAVNMFCNGIPANWEPESKLLDRTPERDLEDYILLTCLRVTRL